VEKLFALPKDCLDQKSRSNNEGKNRDKRKKKILSRGEEELQHSKHRDQKGRQLESRILGQKGIPGKSTSLVDKVKPGTKNKRGIEMPGKEISTTRISRRCFVKAGRDFEKN